MYRPLPLALATPARFQVLDLLCAHIASLDDQDRRQVLAIAPGAAEFGNEIHWKDTLLSPEFAGDAFEIHVLIKTARKTKRMDMQAGIDHRANRRMPGRIELF
jgi:hypothetical protein